MRRFYVFFSIILFVSLVGNVVFLFLTPWNTEVQLPPSSDFEKESEENISLFNRPESVDYETIQYDTYALDGEPILFLHFVLNGTISGSVEKKYHTRIPADLVQNMQNIVYFLSEYKLKFGRGDHISLYYRRADNKILYLRYKNRSRRSTNEVFLSDDGVTERYFTSGALYLVPCLENGPFSGCPNARLIRERRGLVPIFTLSPQSTVRLPFQAKIMEIGTSRKYGGDVEVIYSDFMKRARFRGFSQLNTTLKKNELYRKNRELGRGGYKKEEQGRDGVIYYLLNKDGSLYSPFLFHHISHNRIDESRESNFNILVRYYQRLYKRGRLFEKAFFVK